MLRFKYPNSLPSSTDEGQTTMKQTLKRKSSFVTSQLGYSKATVVLSNISLPLAWPVNEYLGNKKG